MPYTQASNRAVQKYVKENYDRLQITCKKGMKEKYQAMAEEDGKSLNAFINEMLEKELQRRNLM